MNANLKKARNLRRASIQRGSLQLMTKKLQEMSQVISESQLEDEDSGSMSQSNQKGSEVVFDNPRNFRRQSSVWVDWFGVWVVVGGLLCRDFGFGGEIEDFFEGVKMVDFWVRIWRGSWFLPKHERDSSEITDFGSILASFVRFFLKLKNQKNLNFGLNFRKETNFGVQAYQSTPLNTPLP